MSRFRAPGTLVAAVALAATAPLAAQQTAQPMLVTVEWLAAELGRPDLVLLHIGDDRSRATYDAGHIPGSQFLHPWRDLAAPREEGKLSLELPSTELLVETLESKGISNTSSVVLVMADEYFTPTTRTYLTLMYAGLEGRVSILDGGLEAWKAAGKPVTDEVPTVARARFTPKLDPSVVADQAFVSANLKNPAVRVVDARDTRFYDGSDPSMGGRGHITGAANVPFGSVVENGRFKPPAALRQLLVDAGAAPGTKVVTYCHIGQQATLVWFVARMLGYDAAMYDGSFQEWVKTGQPVVNPKGS